MMQVAVTFRHMETDERARAYVSEKVQKLQKYVQSPKEVHVVLSGEKFRHIAEITIIGNGGMFNSQGRDNDLYAAIDQMMDKMERQVRERRGKVKRKRSNSLPDQDEFQRGRQGRKSEEEIETEDLLPPIKKKRIVAKRMSLEEALSQLHLSKKKFLVFVNSDSGQMNVIYPSQGGGVEWVEPYLKS